MLYNIPAATLCGCLEAHFAIWATVWQPLIAEDSAQSLKTSLLLSISPTVVILNTYEDKAERLSVVNEPRSDLKIVHRLKTSLVLRMNHTVVIS
jgi:hypothetical protein